MKVYMIALSLFLLLLSKTNKGTVVEVKASLSSKFLDLPRIMQS